MYLVVVLLVLCVSLSTGSESHRRGLRNPGGFVPISEAQTEQRITDPGWHMGRPVTPVHVAASHPTTKSSPNTNSYTFTAAQMRECMESSVSKTELSNCLINANLK